MYLLLIQNVFCFQGPDLHKARIMIAFNKAVLLWLKLQCLSPLPLLNQAHHSTRLQINMEETRKKSVFIVQTFLYIDFSVELLSSKLR
jgi:hypothetical protein